MKTIEEIATEYARLAQNCEKCGEDNCLQENFRCDHFRRVYYAFINGAKKQKEIDIDKAYQWLKDNLYPIELYGLDACENDFRKAMKE